MRRHLSLSLITLTIVLLTTAAIAVVAESALPPAAATAAVAPSGQGSQAPPADAAPIAVSPEDVSAIAGAMLAVQGFQRSIAALQKESDAAAAEGQRAFARAQAKHPTMPISTQTWLYTPVPKAAER